MYFLLAKNSFTRPGTLILLTVAIAFASNAQNNFRIDSLQRSLSSASKADQVGILVELAIEYADHDNTKSLEYADKAFQIVSDSRDSTEIVHIGRIKGQILRRVERIEESIELFEALLPSARKLNLTQDLKIMLNSLAISYTMKADYYKALDLNFQSLIIREREGDKAEISIALNNIGFVYFKLKNYDKALEYYLRALELKKEVNDNFDLDHLLVNIALCYNNTGRYQEAKEMVDQAEILCREGCSEGLLIDIKFSQGMINFGLMNYEKARQYFNDSYKLSVETDNKRFQVENLFYLGKLAYVGKQYDQAESYYKAAQEIASEFGYNQLLINIYREFATLYGATRDYSLVAEFQEKYIQLKDSLIGEELVKNIASIQTQFEERQNRATIATKEEELSRQRTLNVAIGIIAILSALLVFVLYRNNQTIKRVNNALADANSVIEMQNVKLQSHADHLQQEVDKATNELKVLNTSLRKANEEMDHLIYKTSHDIRGPLATLKGICNVALMDIKDPEALEYFEKLSETATLLDRILTRLQLVNQVSRSVIHHDQVNLKKLTEEIIQDKSRHGLPANMIIERNIPADLIINSDYTLLYIILENLIENAIKFYSRSDKAAPRINISMDVSEGQLRLSVRDNGIGIAEENLEKVFQMFSRASERSPTGGLGLYLVRLASTRMGGQATAHRNPDGFTEFRVVIPVAPKGSNTPETTA